jgi:hypothetical protein
VQDKGSEHGPVWTLPSHLPLSLSPLLKEEGMGPFYNKQAFLTQA